MKAAPNFLSFFILLGSFLIPISLNAQSYPATDILLDFVRVEGGSFAMGSPASEVSRQGDESRHRATVETFYMGKNEVTQREYERVMGANPSRFVGASMPVERVSWYDAVDYCNARSAMEGLDPAYIIRASEILWDHGANGYRLPTEAEWEYACRADTATAFHTGNKLTAAQANFDGNYPYNQAAADQYRARTTPARSFAPNAWGLYDMHGNVYEWCWDQYKPYGDKGLDGSLQGPGLMRGGSWFSEARFLRSANRVSVERAAKADYIGFRVARSAL